MNNKIVYVVRIRDFKNGHILEIVENKNFKGHYILLRSDCTVGVTTTPDKAAYFPTGNAVFEFLKRHPKLALR